MKRYKRTRARRSLSRRRKSRRKSTKRTIATKAYVQKALSRKMESKMCQYSNAFYYNSEDSVYNNVLCYKYSSVGTTDRGRIGNTIWATKIVVRYKFVVEYFANNPENYDDLVPEGVPPITMKFFIVKRKSTSGILAQQWFKSKDRGQEYPIEALNFENIQNGLNALNTDVMTIVAMKNVTARCTRDNRNVIHTGTLTYRFPKPTKITLNENSTNVVDDALVSPQYVVYMYPYWGTDSAHGTTWGLQYSVQQYYKD